MGCGLWYSWRTMNFWAEMTPELKSDVLFEKKIVETAHVKILAILNQGPPSNFIQQKIYPIYKE